MGILVTVILFMQFGNPSSGGSNGVPYLPSFWSDLGLFLPPRNALDLLRNSVYFGGNGIGQALTVLLAYTIISGGILFFLEWYRPEELSVAGLDKDTAADAAAAPPGRPAPVMNGPAPVRHAQIDSTDVVERRRMTFQATP